MAKEIGELNVKIGLDSTGFQNGMGTLNREWLAGYLFFDTFWSPQVQGFGGPVKVFLSLYLLNFLMRKENIRELLQIIFL